MKTCSKCKQEKDEAEYHKSPTHRGGLHPQCKVCRRAYIKAWKKQSKAAKREETKKRRKHMLLQIVDQGGNLIQAYTVYNIKPYWVDGVQKWRAEAVGVNAGWGLPLRGDAD